MGILFEVKNLSKSFKLNDSKSLCILNELNFTLEDKGLFCIFGKSGCGKSTLLNILEGLMKPSKGEVLYKGKSLSSFKEKEQTNYLKNEVGMVFQSFNLIDDLTVYENLKLAMKIKGVKKYKSISNELAKYNIENLKNKKINVLSGGEKQRVAIIRSLINDPTVVFADEPTGNLDKDNSINVMNFLKEISMNRLVIMVSHNKELIDKYNDGYLDLTNGTQTNFIAMKGCKNIVEKNKKNKNSSFVSYMLIKSFKKDIKQNLLSFFSIVFAFLLVFLSIGFNNGIIQNSEGVIQNYQNYNSYKISKVLYESISDSNLKLERIIRPKKNEIIEIANNYNNSIVGESIDYFFNEEKNVEINSKIIENVSFIPVNNIPNGKIVYVNNAFKEAYSKVNEGSCLNRFVNLNLKRKYIYNNTQNSGPNVIEEIFEAHFEFDIEKIRYEFGYLNYPKIYFSYNYFLDYLKNYKCTKINEITGNDFTFYDLLVNSKDNEEISNYSYILFLDSIEDAKDFNSKIDSLEGFNIKNEPYTIVNSFKNMTSAFFKGIILFIAISIICSLAIVGFLSFSSFVFNRKQTAIISALGAVKNDVILVYLIEKIIVLFLSFLVSYILLKKVALLINSFIFSTFYFRNLLVYPFNDKRLNLSILMIGLFFIIFIVTIPLLLAKHREIYKELKEE
jgi:ABC-type lipoprotein export system ATPase subunit